MLTLTADGQDIQGWQDVTVTRGIENFPSNFSVSLTERFPQEEKALVIIPGRPCTVKLGDDLVLTGYVDQYQAQIGPSNHDITITGRSKCEDLVDCSAFFGKDGNGNTAIINQTVTQIAKQLLEPFGITVTNKTGDDGPPIQLIVVNLGETPYEIIEKCARWVGLLVYDDVDGNLVLDRLGSTEMASGFKQGENIQNSSVNFRMDQRMTDYYVVWQAMNSMKDLGPSNVHGYAEDKQLKSLGRYRPLYIVSDLVDASQIVLGGDADLGQRIADWECNRRLGRSQMVQITTDSWRDSAGKLWQPNSLCKVNIPALKVNDVTWLIANVTYQRGLTGGTTSVLTLMPKEAFSIEPISILPADADLVLSLRTGSDYTATKISESVGSPQAPPPVTSDTVKGKT